MKRPTYDRWKFTVLLGSLCLFLVIHPLLSGEAFLVRLVYHLLFAVVLVSAVSALVQRPRSRIVAAVLGVPTLIGVVAGSFVPGMPPVLAALIFHLLPIAFLGYTVLVILRTIFESMSVTWDCINGAFCGYLLVGVAFGHLFCLVETIRPGSYAGTDRDGVFAAGDERGRFTLTYFSLMTMTTVGYGDITPRTPPARSLAAIEAVLGQFYIAVIISTLIALNVSAAMRGPPGDAHSSEKARP